MTQYKYFGCLFYLIIVPCMLKRKNKSREMGKREKGERERKRPEKYPS